MDKVVGRNIKKIRESMGINQEQLAEYLQIDQSFVSKCEKDERQFGTDALNKICNLFGISLPDLIEGKCDETIQFAFRANGIGNEDLQAISYLNKIVLNLRQMGELLEDK